MAMEPQASSARDADLVANLGWVLRLARALVRDEDVARDVTQDVSRAWLERAREPRSEHGGIRAWLAAVTRRIALDRQRSEQSRQRRERAVAAAETSADPSDVVARNARLQRVAQAVMELAEPYRSTVLLRYLDELSTAEVARRTGTSEPTVRKRLERGLALLRARLERDFGSRSETWAVALLGPTAHTDVSAGTAAAIVGKGMAIMSTKWLVAAGAVALLAVVVWRFALPGDAGGASRESGYATITLAEASSVPAPAAASVEATPLNDERTSVAAGNAAAKSRPIAPSPALHGKIYVDDVQRVPQGLAIAGPGSAQGAQIDAVQASWSAVLSGAFRPEVWGSEPTLWITSPSTIPLQVQLEPDHVRHGAVVDLHLVTGRTLELTFVDRHTQLPLARFPFVLGRSVVVGRTRTQRFNRSDELHLVTDDAGRSTVRGIPADGWISVYHDTELVQRELVMRGGGTASFQTRGEALWQMWITEDLPETLAQTIYTSVPLGEAFARGVVPAWASAGLAPDETVRVVACERQLEGDRQGDAIGLAQDAVGAFELRAGAPSRHRVWLERMPGRKHASAMTDVEFQSAGAQPEIVFRPSTSAKVGLNFVHVPSSGSLGIVIFGERGASARRENVTCAGRPMRHEIDVSPGDHVQVAYRAGADDHGKDGLEFVLSLDPQREPEVTIDLAGTARRVSLEARGVELKGDAFLMLLSVEGNVVMLDKVARAPITDGRGTRSVLLPHGRWFYLYADADQEFRHVIAGLVDVAPADEGAELVLTPVLDLTDKAQLGDGIVLEEIDGVSLDALPESARQIRWKNAGDVVALPSGARYRVIPAAR